MSTDTPQVDAPAANPGTTEVPAAPSAGPEAGSSTLPFVKKFTAEPPREPKRKLDAHDPSLEPMSEVMLRRTTKIQEGDNVLLKLPSDSVKAVVASKDG